MTFSTIVCRCVCRAMKWPAVSGLLWNTLMCIHVYIDVSYVAVLCPKTSTLPPYLCLVTGRLIGFFPTFSILAHCSSPFWCLSSCTTGVQCACVCLCALCALHLPRQCAHYQYMFSHSTPPPTRRSASGAFLCVELPPHIAYSPSFVCCICTLIQRKKCRHPPSCFAVCLLSVSVTVFVCLHF